MLDYIIVSCSIISPVTTPDVAVVKSTRGGRKRKSETPTSDVSCDVKFLTSRTEPAETCNNNLSESTKSENDVKNSDELSGNHRDDQKLSKIESEIPTSAAKTTSAAATPVTSATSTTTISRVTMSRDTSKRTYKKNGSRKSRRSKKSRTKSSSKSLPSSNRDECDAPTSAPTIAATAASAASMPSAQPPVSTPAPTPASASAAATPVSVSATPASATTTAAAPSSSVSQSDDDNCLSISTSVTVVISRRTSGPNATASASAVGTGNDVTVETGNVADNSRQFVVNAKIPNVSSFAFTTSTDIQQPNVATAAVESQEQIATPGGDKLPRENHNDAPRDGAQKQTTSADMLKRGSQKRKSLESVIKALKPTAVVAATSAVGDSQPASSKADNVPLVSGLTSVHSSNKSDNLKTCDQPLKPVDDVGRPNQVVDLSVHAERTRSETPSGGDPKSCQVRFPTVDGEFRPAVGFTTAASMIPFATRVPPPGGAAFAANRCNHLPSVQCAVCLQTAAMCSSLPTYCCSLPATGLSYYSSGQAHCGKSPHGNGYDAPLELTNKRPRDRK